MSEPTPQIIELNGLADPLLLPWLDLYETAFPPGDRIPVSRIIGALQDQACGGSHGKHFLAALDAARQLVAMVYLFGPDNLDAAFLWYFAVVPDARSHGLGSRLYHYLIAHLRPGTKILIYDVEDPGEMESAEGADLARRRIAFYRRQGARMLEGARVIYQAASRTPVMHFSLMVHLLDEITPQEAFDCAKAAYAEYILQASELRWG